MGARCASQTVRCTGLVDLLLSHASDLALPARLAGPFSLLHLNHRMILGVCGGLRSELHLLVCGVLAREVVVKSALVTLM